MRLLSYPTLDEQKIQSKPKPLKLGKHYIQSKPWMTKPNSILNQKNNILNQNQTHFNV